MSEGMLKALQDASKSIPNLLNFSLSTAKSLRSISISSPESGNRKGAGVLGVK